MTPETDKLLSVLDMTEEEQWKLVNAYCDKHKIDNTKLIPPMGSWKPQYRASVLYKGNGDKNGY